MPRPVKPRNIQQPPTFFQFIPQEAREISTKKSETEDYIQLKLDEWEVFRLTHYLGLDHAEGALIMGISRPTFTRLVDSASRKLATMLIEGKRMQISGGKIQFSKNVFCCTQCHRPFIRQEEEKLTCPACGNTSALIPHPQCMGDCECCQELNS